MNPPRLIAALIGLSVSSSAVAGDVVEPGGGVAKTAYVKVSERTNRGKLDTCEIEYRVVFEDHVYRRGAISALVGAVSFMGFIEHPAKTPALVLKAGGFDFEGQRPVPFEIPYAFIKVGKQSYAGKEYVNFTCETGGACVAYDIFKVPTLASAIGKAFSVTIIRKGGGIDISIPVSILPQFADEGVAYGECSLKLLTALEQKLGH